MIVLTNPFPRQVYLDSQPRQGQATPPDPPSGHHNYQILMMNYDDVNTVQVNL